MNSSWKKFRTAVRFLAIAKGPSTAAAKEDISEQLRQRVAILQKLPDERTDEDLTQLNHVLEEVKLTSGLPLRVKLEVSKKCAHRKGAAGEVLFKQGEEGREFFIILDGVVTCSTINPHTGQSSVVARLTAHQSLGEKALQASNARQTATVTLEKDSEFMVIGRDDFDVINQHLQSSETSKKVTFLKRVGVFSQLSSSSLQVISTAMVARTCPKDSVIMRQGDASNEIFFLVTGTCRMIRDVRFSPHESFQMSTLSLVKDAIDSASEAAAGRRRSEDGPGTITGLPLAPGSGAETIILPASLVSPSSGKTGRETTEAEAEEENGQRRGSENENDETEISRATRRPSLNQEETEVQEEDSGGDSVASDDELPPGNVGKASELVRSRSQSRVSFLLPSPSLERNNSVERSNSLERNNSRRKSALNSPPKEPEPRADSAPAKKQNTSRSALEVPEVSTSEGFSPKAPTGRFHRAPLGPFFPAGINSSHGERIYPWERAQKSPTKTSRLRTRSRSAPPEAERAARARSDVYSNKQLPVTQMLKAVPKRKEKARRLFLELGQIQPPAYFGEVGVLRNEARQTSIVAATNVELYVINKLDFQVRVGRDAIKQMEQRIADFPTDETIRKLFLKNILWSNYKAALVSEVTAHRNGNGKPTSAVPLPSCNFRQPDGQTVRLPRLLERRMTSATPNPKLMKGPLMSLPL